ncbi:Small GTPase superfamily [Sesbania bispinosa]|nr:Small GTPase superfamily [Sesbania bispinosa]
MSSSSGQSSGYDLSFKILLIGDSAVGKSSLLVSFISNSVEDLAPTIGVDFKIKLLTVGGKRLKLTIWDTAGQERFRTLTSSYYRGAQGIILVYDVTRRDTFTNLSEVWSKEVELYSTNQDCVKVLVGNKVDRDSERLVSREEGLALAEELGCLFFECSAKTRENVEQCFEELALKALVRIGFGGEKVRDDERSFRWLYLMAFELRCWSQYRFTAVPPGCSERISSNRLDSTAVASINEKLQGE